MIVGRQPHHKTRSLHISSENVFAACGVLAARGSLHTPLSRQETEEAMVERRDGRTKEGRGGRAARTGREQTAPAGHLETFAKNASYMGGLREGWIEKHSNKEEATGGTGRGAVT